MKITITVFVIAATAILMFAVALSFLYPDKYRDEINGASSEFGVDAELIRGVIHTESRFRRDACSRAGAMGLMQLMPKTAEWIAKEIGTPSLADDLYDAESNIRLGTAYLKYLLGKYSLRDALAAYNAGEGNLDKWKSEGREEYGFAETRDYVKKVLRAEKIYRKLR